MGETLFENGTLMVEEVTKFSEAGEYKCYVKNTIDEVEGKLDVVVLGKTVLLIVTCKCIIF